MFLITVLERNKFYSITDYDVELLSTWKNYNTPSELLKLDVISIQSYGFYDFRTKDSDYNKIKSHVPDIVNAIDRNGYRIEDNLNKIDDGSLLLKASGLSEYIDPQEIFCAIEEYFSREKTSQETTEAKGATNDDKIIMHGFDTKISFRGR